MTSDGEIHDFDETVDFGQDEEFTEDEVRVARRITDLDRAARLLRVVALVAFAIWVVGVVTLFWSAWDQASRMNAGPTFGSQGINSFGDTFTTFRQALAATIGGTWAYLALAVATYVASVVLAMRYEDALRTFTDEDDQVEDAAEA